MVEGPLATWLERVPPTPDSLGWVEVGRERPAGSTCVSAGQPLPGETGRRGAIAGAQGREETQPMWGATGGVRGAAHPQGEPGPAQGAGCWVQDISATTRTCAHCPQVSPRRSRALRLPRTPTPRRHARPRQPALQGPPGSLPGGAAGLPGLHSALAGGTDCQLGAPGHLLPLKPKLPEVSLDKGHCAQQGLPSGWRGSPWWPVYA